MNYTRQELYDLLWSKPLNTATATLSISMPVLRQICLNYNIPLPYGSFKNYQQPIVLQEGADFDLPAAIATAANSLAFPGERLTILPKLTDPDPLIVTARDTVQEDWHFHRMQHMLRAGNGELAIRASKSNYDRALRIMDTLVKAWRHRGYRIGFHDKETKVYLRVVSLGVSIRETTTVEPPKEKYGSQVHTATGLLAFKINGYHDREWKDGKVPLETDIKNILDHMEVTARELEAIWAENKIRDRQRAEERQAEAKRIQSDTEESAAFEALVAEAKRWNDLIILDKYLGHLRQEIPRSPAFDEWLQWAHHRRHLFDPTSQQKLKQVAT
jgi:hypothetical protein